MESELTSLFNLTINFYEPRNLAVYINKGTRMARKKSGSGNNNAAPTTSQSIQEKTEEYLKNGGRINVIKTGVTGLNYLKTSKHINISGNKNKV